jgi:RHS repeat-associated protein
MWHRAGWLAALLALLSVACLNSAAQGEKPIGAADAGGNTQYAQYTYLGAGTIVKVAHPSVTGGLALVYGTGGTHGGFDRFGKVVDQRWQNDTPAVLDQFKYGYDRASNRIWRDVGPDMGTPPTGKDEFYIYDGLHRLIKANRGTLAGTPPTIADADAGASHAWAAWSGSQWQSRLDALGNWPVFKQDSDGGGSGDAGWELTQTRLHNKVNEIDNDDNHANAPSGSISGGSWVLPAHDAAGNMTRAPRPGQESTASEGLLMVYDAWNRQAAVYRDANGDGAKDANDPLIQEARYDGLNRRITKIVRHVQGETVTYDRTDYYYNEGWQCLEERTGSHASLGDYPPNESGARGTVATAVKVQWLWDIRYIDAPVLRWRDADANSENGLEETLYYANDANRNVTALVNTSGTVVERYAYDPYGKPLFFDASWNPLSASAYSNEILYCGYRWDPETGLYDVGYRKYHPTLGAWISRDPDEGATGSGLYEYAWSSPANYVDPDGAAPQQASQATAGRGFTRAARSRAQFPNRLDVMADLKAALESLCPCLAYNISPDGNRLDIGANPKYGDDPAKPTPEDFCCCYYQYMAGCNLVLMYRDGTDRKGKPLPDTPVQPGADVSGGVMGVGDSRTQEGKTTTTHELGHVVLGGGQKESHNASRAMGTIIGRRSNQRWAKDPIQEPLIHDPYAAFTRRALDEFGRNRYPDCEGRVGKAPQQFQDAPAKLRQEVERMKGFFAD